MISAKGDACNREEAYFATQQAVFRIIPKGRTALKM
jgi:hypothetical protein